MANIPIPGGVCWLGLQDLHHLRTELPSNWSLALDNIDSCRKISPPLPCQSVMSWLLRRKVQSHNLENLEVQLPKRLLSRLNLTFGILQRMWETSCRSPAKVAMLRRSKRSLWPPNGKHSHSGWGLLIRLTRPPSFTYWASFKLEPGTWQHRQLQKNKPSSSMPECVVLIVEKKGTKS